MVQECVCVLEQLFFNLIYLAQADFSTLSSSHHEPVYTHSCAYLLGHSAGGFPISYEHSTEETTTVTACSVRLDA